MSGRQTHSSSSCQIFRGLAFKVKEPGTSAAEQHTAAPVRGALRGGRSYSLALWQRRKQLYGDGTPRAAPQRAAKVTVHCAEVTGTAQEERGEKDSGICCLIFFYQFSLNTNSILCVHNSKNQPHLPQRLDFQTLHCHKHDRKARKQSMGWKEGKSSNLWAYQTHSTQRPLCWVSLEQPQSCSTLPSAAGPLLGGKHSLVTDPGTTVLPG